MFYLVKVLSTTASGVLSNGPCISHACLAAAELIKTVNRSTCLESEGEEESI